MVLKQNAFFTACLQSQAPLSLDIDISILHIEQLLSWWCKARWVGIISTEAQTIRIKIKTEHLAHSHQSNFKMFCRFKMPFLAHCRHFMIGGKNIMLDQIKLFWTSCKFITAIKNVNTPIKRLVWNVKKKKNTCRPVGPEQTNPAKSISSPTGCPPYTSRFYNHDWKVQKHQAWFK